MRGPFSQPLAWMEDRTGLQSAIRSFLLEEIPASAGWPHVFGSVTLFLFLVQGLTGLLLALDYAPTSGEAYTSLTYIVRQVAGGRIIHGLHHWGSSFLIVVVLLHMTQVFVYGAFQKPREPTWISGVTLLLLTFGFGLTGYLLPWDNKAYWGTVVTTRIAASLPAIGKWLVRLAGAENGVGALTFSRFYALHTLILPALTIGLIAIHVYLVRRHGITPSRSTAEARQKFYPRQLFRDAFSVLAAFAALFLVTCLLDVPLERMADPNDTQYVPRPEWYFLFLFQLLKVFPGRLELIGTFLLPFLTVLTLILLPFLSKAHATVLKGKLRSTAVAALAFSAWLGFTLAARTTGPQRSPSAVAFAQAAQWARIAPEAIAGSTYFRSEHCDGCHNLILGTPKPGPTLGITGTQRSRDWLLKHFDEEGPARTSGHEAARLSLAQRNALIVFVATVKPDDLQTLSAIAPEISNGAQTYVVSGCASCHKVNGIGGQLGPPLNGLATRRTENWVRAHFASPRKLSPGSIMPSYHLAAKDEQDLIGYLFSLPD